MKIIAIIALAFVLLVPISSFAQSSSQENNCPVGTKPVVKGTTIECVQITNIQRTCPDGTYQGRDNQGNFACRDIDTNQIVDPNTGLMYDSQTGEVILDDNQSMYVGIGIVIVIIIIGGIFAVSRKKSEPQSDSYKDVERKYFTFSTKEEVKEIQEGRCNICGRIPNHWEFDHINGRGDNSIENCQGLCRDCHQSKTLDDNEKHRD